MEAQIQWKIDTVNFNFTVNFDSIQIGVKFRGKPCRDFYGILRKRERFGKPV